MPRYVEPNTLSQLEDIAQTMPKPHPLSGLTVVYYAENMANAARIFVTAYNSARVGQPAATARLSRYLPPGHMVGMRGTEIVMSVSPPKPPEESK